MPGKASFHTNDAPSFEAYFIQVPEIMKALIPSFAPLALGALIPGLSHISPRMYSFLGLSLRIDRRLKQSQ